MRSQSSRFSLGLFLALILLAGLARPAAADLNPRGAWDAAALYRLDDIVTSRGSTWRALRNSRNKPPGRTAPSTAADWEEFAAGYNNLGPWSDDTLYHPNDIVLHGGSAWIAKETNRNRAPDNPRYVRYWAKFVPGLAARGVWRSTTFYAADDVVTLGGSTWRARRTSRNVRPGTSPHDWEQFAAKGSAGAQGPAGPQGAQGPAGPQGAQGPQGPSGLLPTCASNQVMKFNGNSWTCSADVGFPPPGSCAVGSVIRGIDANGSLTCQSLPMFAPGFAAQAALTGDIGPLAWTRVPFLFTAADPGNNFDESTSQYTAPRNGFYLLGFSFTAQQTGVDPPVRVASALFKNEGLLTGALDSSSWVQNDGRHYNVSTLAYLTAGDLIEVRVWFHTNGGKIDDGTAQFWAYPLP